MKAYKIFYLVIAFAMLFACVKKDNELKLLGEESSSLNAGSSDTATASEETGCVPDYGDSVLCYQLLSSGQDYKVSPLNNPGKGKYIAMPEGLIIDNNTGEINVTKSESGLAYKVGFIAEGSSDTCFTRVITSASIILMAYTCWVMMIPWPCRCTKVPSTGRRYAGLADYLAIVNLMMMKMMITGMVFLMSRLPAKLLILKISG